MANITTARLATSLLTSENSARRMEMIQKRTMIFGSAQPFFS